MEDEVSKLREQAKSYRRMLVSVDDSKARDALTALAKQCEETADALASKQEPQGPSSTPAVR